jgi:hypothetical protein
MVAGMPAVYEPFRFAKVYYTAGVGVGFILMTLHALIKLFEEVRGKRIVLYGSENMEREA